MHIVDVTEMRDLEARADQEYGLSSHMLMENAGKSAAELLAAYAARQGQHVDGLEVVVLVGPGNNGGDGLVVARHLTAWGARVSIYRWKEKQLSVSGQDVPPEQTPEALERVLRGADYVLDALLGTGRSRPLPDDMRDLLALVQRTREESQGRLRVVAIDLPTGLNADTGAVDPGTIRADLTITLACPKQGFFFFPGRAYMGELAVGSIGLPPEMEQGLQKEMLDDALVKRLLPPRPLNSNKGTFGKVMLFCGTPPYPGSAYLAGTAAGRVGAGLVTLAVHEKMLPIYASSMHETTFALLPDESQGSAALVETLMEQLKGYRALLVGPGLGRSDYVRDAILQLLERLRALPNDERPALIVDADGLNNLSTQDEWWKLLPPGTVITPHPGEMGRLCKGVKVSGVDIDRLDLARSSAREWGLTLLLKGACTIIAEPGGRLRINWHANPALATAGTGDVLAGMIAGLLAQRLAPFDAASVAVYLHVATSQLVSEDFGSAGLLAPDLLGKIPMARVKVERS